MANKKIKKTTKRSAYEISSDLAVVRAQIKDLKNEDDKYTAELLDAMHDEQIKEAGNYQIIESHSLKVKDEKLAIPYAASVNAVKIDTTKIKEILRHTFDDPSKYGFGVTVKESISPIKRGNQQDEE